MCIDFAVNVSALKLGVFNMLNLKGICRTGRVHVRFDAEGSVTVHVFTGIYV